MNVRLDSAIGLALDKADSAQIPMTVFKNAHSLGWWFIDSRSSMLFFSELHMTALPSNYFH